MKIQNQNGIHLGGFDKCGIPQDVYDYNQLSSKNFEDGCNKSSPQNVYGNGVGSACLAFIKASNWTIDKNTLGSIIGLLRQIRDFSKMKKV